MPLHIFLSYSHKSRKLAGQLKAGLEHFDFTVFLAHEDIKPSAHWRTEIRKNLRDCDVFIPLLTRGFSESDWTDQETGIALALKKKIIPIKVHQNPHGFIEAVQALKWNKESPYITSWEVTDCLRTDEKFAQAARNGAISAFLSANDFRKEVPYAVSKLLRFRPFSVSQLHRIVEGSSRSHAIFGCWAARTPMETLIRDAKGKVSQRVIRRYREAVESWG
ncbi:MAG TPA: toll/interleukin-1 receptor domain-containing protein [Candidatus Acidoferrum sp.]|nr:toll/interleukin-1 receptor domain-containing protein [Candidatus Acidoferrum sp.]